MYVKCCHCRQALIEDLLEAGLIGKVMSLWEGILQSRGEPHPDFKHARITERQGDSFSVVRFMAGAYSADMTYLLLWENGCPYCDGDGWVWKNEGGEE